jgi:hypothetical protein
MASYFWGGGVQIMPNIKSAEKRVSIARARNAKNKAIRSE